MHIQSARLWTAFCLGIWLMGNAAMAVVATQNFWIIDRLIEAQPHPRFNADVEKLGRDETGPLLYYFSSELNRLFFQYWNLVQLAVGVVALWLTVKIPGADRTKWAIVSMLAIVLFLTAIITPRIVSVGRELDFVLRDPPPPGLRTFGLLHAAYTVFFAIEVLLGVLGTLWLVRYPAKPADRSMY